MKRVHALEWEDLQWFPKDWRDYGTDYLQFIANKFSIYDSIVPIIQRGIETSSSQEWVDCASGGGGGLLSISKSMLEANPNLKITVTDYFPNIEAFDQLKQQSDVFQFESESVDARNVPAHLKGKFRTMFASFHHFRPTDAKAILQNAVDTNTPIAIFEPVDRNLISVFSMLFVPINVLIFTLFMRPVRWSVFPFIYLLPIIPLYILWDGIASILRIYSEKELVEMVKELANYESFKWEIGKQKQGSLSTLYLLGVPK